MEVGSYSSGLMQLVYSTVPADWATIVSFQAFFANIHYNKVLNNYVCLIIGISLHTLYM